MKAPKHCHSMTELRAAIDELDGNLVRLLATRAAYIDRAVELKSVNGLPANIPSRVEEVVLKVKANAMAQGFDPELAETLWRQLISWSIAREERKLGKIENPMENPIVPTLHEHTARDNVSA